MALSDQTCPEIFSTKTAADYLLMSERTLEEWRRLRKGPPYIQCEGSIRYKKSDLDAWINASRISFEGVEK